MKINCIQIKTKSFVLDCSIHAIISHCTVGENIIDTIKMQNNLCYPSDSNIGLFPIAPHLVIALTTLL